MFADYRVPQVLHRLRTLRYPPPLVDVLRAHAALPPGAREEVSIRAGSVLAVERLRDAIAARRAGAGAGDDDTGAEVEVTAVLLDFYLWDLAKELDTGAPALAGAEAALAPALPAHRTRSIWY
jgi:hypothetical protein